MFDTWCSVCVRFDCYKCFLIIYLFNFLDSTIFCLFSFFQVSPDVKVLGSKSLVQSVAQMTKKSNAMYNSKLQLNGSSRTTTVNDFHGTHDESLPSYAHLTQSFVVKSKDLTSGGKLPLHGPRRFVNAGPLFRGDYDTDKPKFYQVSKSELENYEILCKLASSEFQWLVVVLFSYLGFLFYLILIHFLFTFSNFLFFWLQ